MVRTLRHQDISAPIIVIIIIIIYTFVYGRNFRGAGPGSVLVGVRRGKRVSLGEEKCL